MLNSFVSLPICDGNQQFNKRCILTAILVALIIIQTKKKLFHSKSVSCLLRNPHKPLNYFF